MHDGNGVRTNCVELFEFMEAYDNAASPAAKKAIKTIITITLDHRNLAGIARPR